MKKHTSIHHIKQNKIYLLINKEIFFELISYSLKFKMAATGISKLEAMSIRLKCTDSLSEMQLFREQLIFFTLQLRIGVPSSTIFYSSDTWFTNDLRAAESAKAWVSLTRIFPENRPNFGSRVKFGDKSALSGVCPECFEMFKTLGMDSRQSRICIILSGDCRIVVGRRVGEVVRKFRGVGTEICRVGSHSAVSGAKSLLSWLF
ncbi:hypothetical protein GQR58_004791 [Nymphon striatum]|nr:hypothetical protein GQR58_004791 [Nymphon striatum]